MGTHDIWDEIERGGTGEHLSEEMFEYISAYADGECNAKERRLVEAYVAENAEARDLLADLRSQSAMVAGDINDSPEWLRSAILKSTVDKRSPRWPFAAGLAAAAAAAALAVVTYLPEGDLAETNSDVLARNEPRMPSALDQRPELIPPQIPEAPPIERREVVPTPARQAEPKSPSSRKQGGDVRMVAAPVKKEVAVIDETPPPTVVETTETETATYAVVEYGSGRFQPTQPDVVDGSAVQAAEPVKPAPRPEVLPDARERLRDKVRKLNEEKIEVGEKEKSGS